jgi:hypothetical protein
LGALWFGFLLPGQAAKAGQTEPVEDNGSSEVIIALAGRIVSDSQVHFSKSNGSDE